MDTVFLVIDTHGSILGVYKTEQSAKRAAETAKSNDHNYTWKMIYRGCWTMWIETDKGLEPGGLYVDTHDLN